MSGDGGNSDLHISREALQDVTKGLDAAIEELEGLGSQTSAHRGSGFVDLDMSAMEAGDPQLTHTFHDFCDRWEWGVRRLVLEASALAEKLHLAAGVVREEDEYRAGTFKVVANSAIGNPHADEETITDPKMGYGDMLSQWKPNSDESVARMQEDVKQSWKETAAASYNSGTGREWNERAMDAAGVSEGDRDRMRDLMEENAAQGRDAQEARDAAHQRAVWNGEKG